MKWIGFLTPASGLAALLFSVAACATATEATDAGPDATPMTADAAQDPADANPDDPDARPGDPDAAVPPDAAQDPADACVPDWIELLANPGFDDGDTIWMTTTDGSAVIRPGGPWAPQTGSHAAYFLGYNDGVQSLSQTVTVPPDATALRLRGYRCFVTQEVTMVNIYDRVNVELRDGGNVLETLNVFSNLDAASFCNWVTFDLDAASAYPGQTITLVMDATSDSSSLTTFAYDTLALEALACP